MEAGGGVAMSSGDVDAGPAMSDPYACLEEEEGDEDMMQDLDPASFHQFVEGAVRDMHLQEKPPLQDGDSRKDASARLGYNVYVGQLACLTIKIAPPHVVTAMSPAVKEVLGFNDKEVVGRSLKIMQGPSTNVGKLETFIQRAAEGESLETALALYSNKGDERIVRMELEPEKNAAGGDIEHIILTLDHGDWVPKKIADAEDGRAKLTLMAEKPWSVKQVSPRFLEMYGLKEEMILGRTLNVVFGPRTDANVFRVLLQGACSARTQHIDMWTCKPSDMSHLFVHVSIFPVVERGNVTHFMVVFKHDEAAGSPVNQSPRRQRPGASSPLAGAVGGLSLDQDD